MLMWDIGSSLMCFCVLLATIEPGLMDEPCDWDVCTEASAPGPLTQIFSRREKKKHVKSEVPVSGSIRDEAVEHSSERKPEKTHPAPKQGAHGKGNPKKVSPVKDALPQSPTQAVPTRKELQDALPKIPPLSSFKSCKSRFMTFEEAERDFQSFITTGLGRSVEVIREFRGREDHGPSDEKHRESVMLSDDGAQCLTQNAGRWKSNGSRPRSVSGSSSFSGSQSDMEENQQDDQTVGSSHQMPPGEYRAMTDPETEDRHTFSVPKPKATTTRSKVCTSPAPKTHKTTCGSNWRSLSQPENCESVPNIRCSRETNQTAPLQTSRNKSKKMKEETVKRGKKLLEKIKTEQKRVRDEGEDNEQEEEGEWSAETYWRACYRAWNDYYSSMCPFQEQRNQRYYSVAQNWMAAYRMNAVYMEELMKY